MKTIKYPGSIVRKSLACATYYNVPIAQEMRTFTLRTDRRVAAPVPTPAPVPRSSHTPSEGARAACRCACGGGCPRCTAALQAKLFVGSSHDPLEQEADRVAEQVLAGPATPGVRRAPPGIQRAAHVAPGAAGVSPRSVDHVLAGQGSPLPSGVQNDMSQRFGHDFSHVRIHTGSLAEASARDVHAKAYTVGHNVVFGAGQYAPDARQGQQLLAHELTHVLQQSGGTSAPYLARSVDDWLAGTVNIAAMTYTQLLAEVDELAQYLDRQTSTSPESARIEQALVSLRAEVNRREVATADPRSRGRGRRAAAAPASDAPLPSRYPRILTEMTSVAYADPAEMRAEYDLIMQWLTRREIGANERRILTAERDSLGPQLRSDRQRVVAERHAARLTTALSPSDEDAHALETMARTIQGISREQGDVFYIHHQGERIRISRDQAAQLRQNLATQLQRAAQSIDSRAQYCWDRYHSQLAINRDSPIIAGISGWLGDVEDPLEELSARYYWVYHRVRAIRAQLQADHLVEAAAMIPPVDFVGGEIGELAKAFYDGLIEGADIARQRLEFTRDASFALAGSIAAVVAAPVVAGFVGAGGLGATGITATVLTTGGTGLVVGTGTAVVRGSSAATGTLAAGGSLDEIGAAFRGEAIRGFREGFINGGAGAAARLLGPALGVGTSLGQQALRRVATEAIVNGTSAMVDVLWQGGTIEAAVAAGLRAAVLSAPGALLGGSNNPIVRNLVAPFTAGGTAYLGARAAGATPEQAMQSAAVAVTSNLVMSRSSHNAEADARLVEYGQSRGASVRATAVTATRRVASIGAAVMIGTAEALPPVHSGFGGTSVVTDGDISSMPVASSSSPSVALPDTGDVAPAATTHPVDTEVTAPVAPVATEDTAPPVSTSPAADTAAPPVAPHVEADPATPAASTTAPAIPVDEANMGPLITSELGLEAPTPAPTGTIATQIEAAARAAEAGGLATPQGDPRGPITGVVGQHGHASQRRTSTGQTGQTRQSAHIGATSLLRTLLGYSRRAALTVLLPPAQHHAFDIHWMRWISNRRRAIAAFGGTTFTAPLSDVLDAQRQAIQQTPNMSQQQRNTLEWMLESEIQGFAKTLPNGMATEVPLPAVLGS